MKAINYIYRIFLMIYNFIKSEVFLPYLKLTGTKLYKSLFLIGLSVFLSSNPFSFLPILFISFPLFFIKINEDNLSYKEFSKRCIFFYSGYFLSQLYWLVIPLTKESGLLFLIPFALLLPIIILIPIFTSVGLFYRFLIRALKIKNNFIKIILFSVLFCIAEFVRSNYIFNGFPWQIFGHFFAKPILMQSAKYINIYFFSFFVFIAVLSPILLKKNNKDRYSFYFILFINILNIFYGFLTLYPRQKSKINDLFIWGFQPNFSAGMYSYNYNNMMKEVLSGFSNRIFASENNIIMGPEAVIPFSMKNKGELPKILGNFLPNQQSLLVVGGVYHDERSNKFYNSMYFLNSQGVIIGLYKKKHLVPFGEYIPMRKFIPKSILEPIAGSSDFGENDDNSNNEAILYQDLPIMIPAVCYDIIFSEDLRNTIEKYQYKNKPHIIINLTNDIWTGFSISPFQHLGMAQFTAVRTNTPVIRLSNNGISAIIDQHGAIVKYTKFNEKDLLIYLFE